MMQYFWSIILPFMFIYIKQDGFKPVSWQQQSCPSDLLKSAQCAKSWEGMPKYLKVFQKLRSMPKVWQNMLIAIFAVQMLFLQYIFFWCAVQIFGVQEKKFWARSTNFCRKYCLLMSEFCRLMALVVPPYVKFLKRSTKVCCIFLGVGWGKSLSMLLYTCL